MKKLIVLVAAIASTAAMARPSTTDYTCGELKDVISDLGAVVMNTGANTYDRFVANRTYCFAQEVTATVFVPTADQDSCAVKKCIVRDDD